MAMPTGPVNPVNSDRVIAQARQEAALAKMVTHGETPGGMAYTRTVQLDDVGGEVLEQWVLHGADHAWSGGSASREGALGTHNSTRLPATTGAPPANRVERKHVTTPPARRARSADG